MIHRRKDGQEQHSSARLNQETSSIEPLVCDTLGDSKVKEALLTHPVVVEELGHVVAHRVRQDHNNTLICTKVLACLQYKGERMRAD